jgi:hypothetical protein
MDGVKTVLNARHEGLAFSTVTQACERVVRLEHFFRMVRCMFIIVGV